LDGHEVHPSQLHPQLIYRTNPAAIGTKAATAARRVDALAPRTAGRVPFVLTVADALSRASEVEDGWRHAVGLNVELEAELDRHRDALRTANRESARQQSMIAELKRQYEVLRGTATTIRSLGSAAALGPPAYGGTSGGGTGSGGFVSQEASFRHGLESGQSPPRSSRGNVGRRKTLTEAGGIQTPRLTKSARV
jgi:hypothetical protein